MEDASLQHENRLSVLALCVLLWFFIIIGRLVYVQIAQHPRFLRLAKEQQQSVIEINATRGVIYDRNRQELAISVAVSSVYANPREIPAADIPAVAAQLAGALGLDASAVAERLAAPSPDRKPKAFVWIKRKVSDAQAGAVAALGLPGVYFFKEDQRFYPNGQLAAQVLGFVGMDNDGLYGLEQLYNSDLSGTPGRVAIKRDARQNSFSTEVIQPPVSGSTLVLNISRPVQYIVEEALAEVMEKSRARAATIIVMDPHTGQILAMANEPTFDPNRYSMYDREVWKNRAISDAYEPGSTFKVLVAAAALEEKLTRPDEPIDCQMGSIVVRGHRFHDHKRFGVLSVSDIIAKSSDVGAIKLGLRLGEEKLYQYARTFGLGRQTGIDLPGEHFGLLQPPDRWSKISIGAISFGQEVGVTPLQILQAVCILANGGYRVKPYVVDRVLAPDGTTVYQAQPERTPVISPSVAEAVSEIMRGVVEHGTAKSALMVSYSAAGKTGTAQKIIDRVYSRSKYVASFVGFAPVENPAMAAVIVLDEPKGHYHGGDVAAPVFKQIADRILIGLGVPQTKEPSPTGEAHRRVAAVPRSGPSVSPMPAAVAPSQNVFIISAEDGAFALPDFRAQSLREISNQCALLGLKLEPIGSGLAVAQRPPAGTRVASGSLCQVWFSTPMALPESARNRSAPSTVTQRKTSALWSKSLSN